jgi:hypothetical protein
MPLPERERICGDPGALSVKRMLPATPPPARGANCTLNDKLCPPVSVAGNVRPLIVKPLPERVARFTTTFTFPLFVSCTAWVLLWPTVTLPKLRETGEIVSPGWVPVPVRETVKGELAASLTIERLPVTAPTDGGANCICIVPLCPARIALKGLPPTAAKPVPEMLADAMLTMPVPVLVKVSVWVALLPTERLPKLNVVALPVRLPAATRFPALVSPAQLERLTIANSAADAVKMANGPARSGRLAPPSSTGSRLPPKYFCGHGFMTQSV